MKSWNFAKGLLYKEIAEKLSIVTGNPPGITLSFDSPHRHNRYIEFT
jgi:hypothetical protein